MQGLFHCLYHSLPPISPPIPFPDADGNFATYCNYNDFWISSENKPIQQQKYESENPVYFPSRTHSASTSHTSFLGNSVFCAENPTRSCVHSDPAHEDAEVTHRTGDFEEIDLTADFMALRDDISQEDHDNDVADGAPEVQLVMTDEWKEYFRNSAALRKHKKKREAAERRRKESGYYDNCDHGTNGVHSGRRRNSRKKRRRRNKKKHTSAAPFAAKERERCKRSAYQNELEFSSLGHTHTPPTTLTVQSRIVRQQKLCRLYGAAAEEVTCAETYLNERFDRACDETQPIMWPEMPIHLIHQT